MQKFLSLSPSNWKKRFSPKKKILVFQLQDSEKPAVVFMPVAVQSQACSSVVQTL